MTLSFNRVCIIGLGLIGGSWVAALRQSGVIGHVVGFDRNLDSMQEAVKLGVIDEFVDSAAIAAQGSDLVILSVPTLAISAILAEVAPVLKESAIVTDVGSVKGSVESAARMYASAHLPQIVLGHPIAGSEKSGVAAIDASLFERQKVILTPLSETNDQALRSVQRLWELAGARVELMSVEHHDQVLAATSHLPHLLAFSLVDTLAHNHENKEIFEYAAGGFRDFTRIASSSPQMWHDIFVANRSAVLDALDLFVGGLNALRDSVASSDSTAMLGVFTRAKVARDHFSKILSKRAYVEPMNSKSLTYIVSPSEKVGGTFRVPGDKSVSHRSIMLGSLAEGVTEVSGFLEGEDSLATLQAFRDMGVVIEGPHRGKVVIHGVGMHGLKQPPGPLYLGNSGTSMRLLSGLLAGQSFDVTLTGDDSLSVRPMNRVADPLRTMGAEIETAAQGRPPLMIKGGAKLKGIHYDLPMASAQVKSSLLLAGLYAEGETSVTEPAPTRDHSERMLQGFGYDVLIDGPTAALSGGGTLSATNIDVPSDISSAAFFMVAASISEGSDITLQHVGVNPTRVGVINILRLMGGDIEVFNEKTVGGEPVADIRIRSAKLKGIRIPEDQVPLAIDEFPALFVAAACAEGETVLTGAEELRVKESDRIQAMVDGLNAIGVRAEGTPDGAVILGGAIRGGEVDSLGDHRIAMAFTVAALKARSEIRIADCANVATSFPGFIELASAAGISVSQLEG